MQTDVSQFDFDMWSNLAKTDPEAFEAKRQEEIKRVIDRAPERLRRRLEGVQWRIEMVRRLHHHPLAACARTFNMMWDSMYGDHGLLEAIKALTIKDVPAQVSRQKQATSAEVLYFRSHSR